MSVGPPPNPTKKEEGEEGLWEEEKSNYYECSLGGGKEGLPKSLMEGREEGCLSCPLSSHTRSERF